MNCQYHPDREAKVQCSGCTEPLCDQCAISQKDGTHKCNRCIALDAANDATQSIGQQIEEKTRKKEGKEAQKERIKRRQVMFQVGFILVCCVIIVIQLSAMMSYDANRPFRHGTYNTDDQTDECINILWSISKELQQGNLPGDSILCPKSKVPFEIKKISNDIVVRVPKPELYGFKEIRISKKYPVPEVIK